MINLTLKNHSILVDTLPK